MKFSSITPDEKAVSALGDAGWEVVGTYLEMETAYPNFGKAEYVTGAAAERAATARGSDLETSALVAAGCANDVRRHQRHDSIGRVWAGGGHSEGPPSGSR